MGNPFSLTFGKKPSETIERPFQTAEILDAFCADPINLQIYMITGIRGSGKTVLLTELTNRLRTDDDWIVIDLNPASDLLQSLAAKLIKNSVCAEIFKKAKLNLSFSGLGIEFSPASPIADYEVAVSDMLEALSRRGKRVLVAIDEVTNSESMHVFASAFQILIRRNLPIFLLMTGLYENIEDLQNEKNLTFLYRAPKITLAPLNLPAIASRYRSLFHLDEESAVEMAKLTKGYPFAFQALGYLTWRNEKKDFHLVLLEYRQYLEEYVYDKIWSELSPRDQALAKGIAESETGEIKEIQSLAGFTSNSFSPYRKRLIRKGLVDASQRGRLVFSLPLFDRFVLDQE